MINLEFDRVIASKFKASFSSASKMESSNSRLTRGDNRNPKLNSPVSAVRSIDLPIAHDQRGNLTFVQNEHQLPFEAKRIYWLYDVPGGESRAGHALKKTHQLLVAVAGSFSVHLDDGRKKRTFFLNRSYTGLYLPPLVWRVIDDFSSGAVCLSIVSTFYDPEDYFRDYEDFLASTPFRKSVSSEAIRPKPNL